MRNLALHFLPFLSHYYGYIYPIVETLTILYNQQLFSFIKTGPFYYVFRYPFNTTTVLILYLYKCPYPNQSLGDQKGYCMLVVQMMQLLSTW